jgi:hypothetical protein
MDAVASGAAVSDGIGAHEDCERRGDRQMATQVSKALLVRLEALPGKEDDVRAFLNRGLSIVEGEPATVRWFALQFGPSSFGIFDAFPDDDGRQAHLSGEVARALGDNTGKLFDEPTIEQLDVVAEKPPA